MFNDDEVRSALSKMHKYNYSPVNGFIEISDGLGSMITSLANEPSVGLFYVQEHTHNALPNVLNLRNNVVAKSREISLHTEDSNDSIAMVRSMTDCGFVIAEDMIKDVTKCLAIMSTKQPKKGLISSKPRSLTTWRGNANDVGKDTEQTANGSSNAMGNVGEELPVSSLISDDDLLVDKLVLSVSGSGKFDEFKGDKEARFEEWLEGNGDVENKRVI